MEKINKRFRLATKIMMEKSVLLTGGGNMVVDGIYGMAGCDIGFPLNDDIPLNVHSNQVLFLTQIK